MSGLHSGDRTPPPGPADTSLRDREEWPAIAPEDHRAAPAGLRGEEREPGPRERRHRARGRRDWREGAQSKPESGLRYLPMSSRYFCFCSSLSVLNCCFARSRSSGDILSYISLADFLSLMSFLTSAFSSAESCAGLSIALKARDTRFIMPSSPCVATAVPNATAAHVAVSPATNFQLLRPNERECLRLMPMVPRRRHSTPPSRGIQGT